MQSPINEIIGFKCPGAQWACNEIGQITSWRCEQYPDCPTAETLALWESEYLASLVQPDWDGFLAAFQRPTLDNALYADLIECIAQSGFGVQDHWNNLKLLLNSQTRSTDMLALGIHHLISLLNEAGHPLPGNDVATWNGLMSTHHFPASCLLGQT